MNQRVEFASQLKAAVDIVDVVSQYVRLRKAGQRYVGLCPFHSEKTPSFNVHPVHQFYKCFGCGAGGDVIKFVMEIEGLSFVEALRFLAERYGVPMPRSGFGADPESRLRGRLFELHEAATQFYERALWGPEGELARRYLAQRGVSESVAREFRLGYAPDAGDRLARHLKQAGFSQDEIRASGLLVASQHSGAEYDRFRGRLMFPIQNETGKVIAFAGRALVADQQPKYLNSPETPIYQKSRLLYNLNRARQAIRRKQRAVLVEGYMDVIGLYQSGVEEAVAACGTALTPEQVRSLHRHADRVVVNFDPDAAGSAATERSIQLLLAEGLNVYIAELDAGMDPDEYIRARGVERYEEKLSQAPGYFLWLVQRARQRFDMRTAEGRISGFRELLWPALRLVPDRLSRAAILSDLAEYLKVEPEVLRREMRRASQQEPKGASGTKLVVPAKEKLLLGLLLGQPEIRQELASRLEPLGAIREWASWPVLEKVIQLERNHPGWTLEELLGRLEERYRDVVHELVFADEMGEAEDARRQAEAFVQELERQERERQLRRLKREVEEAERRGDLATALRMMEELERLRRRSEVQ